MKHEWGDSQNATFILDVLGEEKKRSSGGNKVRNI